MRIKNKNGLKVVVIVAALLLCLALAIGITGAWYQAKRQATGTLNMDQGIIIDYQGFGKESDGVWTRENGEITYKLFSDSNALPGENIAVNASGIRANTESVDFYARVKLSYKFYNGETLVTLANPSDLITTSSQFFGENWVDSGKNDGYFYYATGSTLNKFSKDSTTFVSVFAENSKFVIEGENFTGATDGEGGGFVVDDTTTIDKIEVYFTLETLQGDADAKAEGWGIASEVDFSKISPENANIVTSVGETPVTDEQLNVTINGTTSTLETVKFPYGAETVLEFDSKNVEYIELTYEDNSTEKFYELAASETSTTKNSQIQVKANDSKKVTGYVVGLFSDSEYTGFTYSTKNWSYSKNEEVFYYNIQNGVAVTGYFGSGTELTIPASAKVRSRDFKVVIDGYETFEEFQTLFYPNIMSVQYPCKINSITLNSITEMEQWVGEIYDSEENFTTNYPSPTTISYEALCEYSGLISGTTYAVKEIGTAAFQRANFTSVVIPNSVVLIGSSSFVSCRDLTSITIPNSVTSIEWSAFSGCSNLTTVIFGEGSQLTSIGEGAFENCGLTTITIPNSVTSIGNYAFNGCSSLTSITIPNSVTSIGSYAFYGCSSLKTIIIPDSVTSIGNYAFQDCSSLTSITIPNSVTSIGNDAFSGCNKLTSIVLPEGITEIPSGCFYNCTSLESVTIPSTCTSIGSYAFQDCSSLKTIIIPDSVTSIEGSTFRNCSSLTSITIPDSVTSIGSYAFYGCSSLKTIIIPDSVTSIGNDAFHGCSNLTTVNFGENSQLTSIGNEAFSGCNKLTSIVLPEGITEIPSGCFYNCTSLESVTIPSTCTSIGSYAFYDCSSLTSIVLPEGITEIPRCCFYNCTSLESVTIPSTCTSIGNYAFSGCSNLTTVIFGEGSQLTSIGEMAFRNCGLTTITIPNSVTSIGSYAFYGCSSLTSITIPDSVTSIGSYAFYGCSNLTTTVGDGWVKVEDGSTVDASTLLKDVYYDIRKSA